MYGAPWCPDCRRAKQFLAEHRVEYRWVNVDDDGEALRTIEALQNGGHTIPTIVFPDQSVLLEPTNEALAQKLGLRLQAERAFYDLVIVGGGPAGLAAAIYAAREGIAVLVVDRSALGGQAGVTERIDNYPGFPEGIGGAELARRFVAQADRYQVESLGAVEVTALAREMDDVALTFGTGQQVGAHAVLLAPGSSYRRLGVPGEEDLIGAGVHFCATCDGPFYRGADELLVVGGGNSGLEEGLFLSQFAKKVRVVQRDDRLTASSLLQDKVRDDPRFEFHLGTEIVELRGQGRVEEVVGRTRATGEMHHWHPRAVFVYIGLDPNTQFLDGTVDLDEAGFIATDGMFRTNLEGVYAAGDGRRGSTKQLGAAVGDGIAALIAIRGYLQSHSHLATGAEGR